MTSFLFSLSQGLSRRIGVWTFSERVSLVVRPLVGLGIVLLVYAIVRRNPWPRPFRLRFALFHAVVAPLLAVLWIVVSRLIESIFLGWVGTVPYESEFFLMGILAYVIVAGISYSVESTARAARAEAAAASTQLAALRAQLHPHFLFNALHTVVQLIPVNPALAMEAAEIVAELLRASLEEQREEVPLRDEWRFVSRYLAMERIRFGDRLQVKEAMPLEAMDASLPAFALQTLVENAVRHGAAPRVAATAIWITAEQRPGVLKVTVRNDRDAAASAVESGTARSTGLARLRERLVVLFGNAASLSTSASDTAYEATLVIPQAR